MIGGMDQSPDPAAQHDGAQPAAQHHHDVEVRVRRSPKFGVFMLIGAVLGALIAWVVTSVQSPGVNEAGQPVDTTGVLGLAIVAGVVLGIGAGAIAALIVDRSLAKRSRMLVAEQTDVESPEQQSVVPPTDAGEASFEPLELHEAGGPERQGDEPDRGEDTGEHDRPSRA